MGIEQSKIRRKKSLTKPSLSEPSTPPRSSSISSTTSTSGQEPTRSRTDSNIFGSCKKMSIPTQRPPPPPPSPAPRSVTNINKTAEGPFVELSDGNKMPMIGFGTDHVIGDQGSQAYEAIKFAVKCGYRHFDTAALYKSEQTLGAALRECIDEGLVTRAELYIVTKVWNTRHKRESVMQSCRESLERLGMDYVDLYLVHWPMAFAEDGDLYWPVDETTGKLRYLNVDIIDTWRGMEDIKDAGLAKSIGLSNFNHEQVDRIWATSKHKPVVNQVECHPYMTQEKLLDYSNARKMILTAHCLLGSPASCGPREPHIPVLLDDPVVKELAEKYNKQPGQICIKFLLQRGITVIPKSVTESRIKANFDVTDFSLSADDLGKLLALNKNYRYCVKTAVHKLTPSDHPEYPFHLEY